MRYINLRFSYLLSYLLTYCTWRPSSRNFREYPHIPYISRESLAYILPLIAVHFFLVAVGSVFFLFLQQWRFGRSRSSKVIDFGTNQKRVCNFLLVRHINFGPTLHHFGDIAGFLCSNLIFGVFPLDQIANVGVSLSIKYASCGGSFVNYGTNAT